MQIDTSFRNAYGKTTDSLDVISTRAGNKIDAIYEDENTAPTVEMFLQLMISQMQNQDPMNPVDNTQYVTQMSQIAAMQQMQELAYYSRSNFVMSLIGKEVTVAQNKIGGGYTQVTAPVEKVSLVDGEYKITVKGQQYRLQQIMEIGESGKEPEGIIKDLKLSVQNVSTGSAVISWETPSKDKDPDAEKYTYTLYYSKTDTMDKLEDIKKSSKGNVIGQSGVSQGALTDLEPETTYYVNVVRVSPTGKEEVYKKISFVTAKENLS